MGQVASVSVAHVYPLEHSVVQASVSDLQGWETQGWAVAVGKGGKRSLRELAEFGGPGACDPIVLCWMGRGPVRT